MDMTYSRTEKLVGLFVLGVFLLLLATVVVLGRGKDWFRTYIEYYTSFDESYGLEVDTPVKLFKTEIGRVKRITLVGDRVEVELIVLEEYASRLTSGSRVTVESPTLIGSEYVSIKPGPASAPPIPKGGIIPSRPRRSLTGLLAEFEVEKTAKKLVQAIQDISEITAVLKDPHGPLISTLENMGSATGDLKMITRDLRAGKGTIGSLLKTRELIDRIHGRVDQVGDILDSVDAAAGKAPGAMDLVQDNLAGLGTIRERIVERIDRIEPILTEIEETVSLMRKMLQNMEPASRDLPALTGSSRTLLENIDERMDEIDDILKAVQENFLIKPNLPQSPEAKSIDSGLRR